MFDGVVVSIHLGAASIFDCCWCDKDETAEDIWLIFGSSCWVVMEYQNMMIFSVWLYWQVAVVKCEFLHFCLILKCVVPNRLIEWSWLLEQGYNWLILCCFRDLCSKIYFLELACFRLFSVVLSTSVIDTIFALLVSVVLSTSVIDTIFAISLDAKDEH